MTFYPELELGFKGFNLALVIFIIILIYDI